MKTTLKEQIKKSRELMGVIKESKDDTINLSLATALATIMNVDEEFGNDLYLVNWTDEGPDGDYSTGHISKVMVFKSIGDCEYV